LFAKVEVFDKDFEEWVLVTDLGQLGKGKMKLRLVNSRGAARGSATPVSGLSFAFFPSALLSLDHFIESLSIALLGSTSSSRHTRVRNSVHRERAP